MRRTLLGPEHETFRGAFRTFLDREAVPFVEAWETAGAPDREFIKKAGAAGYLGFEFSPEHGGLGIDDFRYNVVMLEEVVDSGTAGDTFTMQNDIVVPYLRDLTTPEQQERWQPAFTEGRLVTALAMTEPDAGSDLSSISTTARREGDELVLNGSKTFITSGSTCDLALVLARTDGKDGRGTTLVAVEAAAPGFARGRPMRKIGRKGQDTAELFFDECRVPVANIIGEPGHGLSAVVRNLPRERLAIAVAGVAVARHALRLTLEHLQHRVAFGQPLARMQSVRMTLADLHVDLEITSAYVDQCVLALNADELSVVAAAGVKAKATELQWRAVDTAMQLFGGSGYMEENPIARIWRDARVQRIYGGANEVLMDLIGRRLVGQ